MLLNADIGTMPWPCSGAWLVSDVRAAAEFTRHLNSYSWDSTRCTGNGKRPLTGVYHEHLHCAPQKHVANYIKIATSLKCCVVGGLAFLRNEITLNKKSSFGHEKSCCHHFLFLRCK